MSIKVGINGFGRIGRMVMRCCMNHPEIEIVGINDLCPADYLAYMLKYDTMHGKFTGEVGSEESAIVVNGKSIPVFAERDPANLPWAKVGAEYVIESTGLFLTKEKAAGHTVIMLGDGINDSPALSAADVGIAISDGAAIAREIADVTVAADSLNELVILKCIANGLQKRTHDNYRFIMGFNSTLIVLGAMGILPPATSALLHNASTLGVSLKSMTNLLT